MTRNPSANSPPRKSNRQNRRLPPDALLAMQRWLERAVIGLNLCPFAKAVHTKGQIRWVLSDATTPEALLQTLLSELQHLAQTPARTTDTTLLVHPLVLQDFDDFNAFQGVVEAAVSELGLQGVLQVAPFHPQFRFAGTRANDLGNNTNRAPYPTLHLLREKSIGRAVAAFPEPEAIFEKNIATLRKLGGEGYRKLLADG
jgi:uncharacterized protein